MEKGHKGVKFIRGKTFDEALKKAHERGKESVRRELEQILNTKPVFMVYVVTTDWDVRPTPEGKGKRASAGFSGIAGIIHSGAVDNFIKILDELKVSLLEKKVMAKEAEHEKGKK